MKKAISIHALLAESDPRTGLTYGDGRNISIHALLAESDILLTMFIFCSMIFLSTLSLRRATDNTRTYRVYCPAFLSTLSLRRATAIHNAEIDKLNDFYPRSPCGERLHYDNYNLHCVEISIHALLAESDPTANNATTKNA